MRVFPFLSYLNKYSVAEKNELKSLNDEASSLFIWMNYFNPDWVIVNDNQVKDDLYKRLSNDDMILNKYKVYLYVINNDKYDSYKNSNLLPEDNTYFSYMMYLPIYLDYRQGYLNLESQSFIYYGNSELWINAGGYIISKDSYDIYCISQKIFEELQESKNSSYEYRLVNTLTNESILLTSTNSRIINAEGSIEQTYSLLSSRIYSSLDSTSYELDNFNGLIKQFPSSSVIFSNKLIPYYLEEPTSAYRMEDDNYIIVAKSSPSYYEPYSVDVSTKQITFKLVDPSDANYGLETINNFSPFGIRYSNLDNSQIEKDSYVFLKENASYNKSKKWDIYIGDTNNNVWDGSQQLTTELLIGNGESTTPYEEIVMDETIINFKHLDDGYSNRIYRIDLYSKAPENINVWML